MLREKRRNILWGTLTIVALAMLVGCLAIKKENSFQENGRASTANSLFKKEK